MEQVKDQLMNTTELIDYIKVSRRTLFRIIERDEKMPKCFTIGGKSKRWRKSEIDQWLEQTRS
tara:strand:+ start:673 stop:861 length:189 start_codon:yes stop_codon:yes gene_type:complete